MITQLGWMKAGAQAQVLLIEQVLEQIKDLPCSTAQQTQCWVGGTNGNLEIYLGFLPTLGKVRLVTSAQEYSTLQHRFLEFGEYWRASLTYWAMTTSQPIDREQTIYPHSDQLIETTYTLIDIPLARLVGLIVTLFKTPEIDEPGFIDLLTETQAPKKG